MVLAHRFMYEYLIGPIPDGMTIDHLCRVRKCVNPMHMEVVTQKENMLRGNTLQAKNKNKTHCVRGHEFTPDNTLVYRRNNGYMRICRKCKRRREHEAARPPA